MNEKHCQSCGMPMGETDELYGTNKDGGKNEDYCEYCFVKGVFTEPDCTMEEMIAFCVPHMVDMVESNAGMKEDEARNMLREFFPTLKRWNAAS
ncbi:MAG: zinc ribbon domain-containing protein [Oscillospiraceae bacterium]|nr:zinc ribbon domain-containing protein [Oscillospiraceae bacterium]